MTKSTKKTFRKGKKIAQKWWATTYDDNVEERGVWERTRARKWNSLNKKVLSKFDSVCYAKHFIKEIWFPILWRTLVYWVYPCIIGRKISYQHEKCFGFEWRGAKRDLCIRNERRKNLEIRASVYAYKTCERKRHIVRWKMTRDFHSFPTKKKKKKKNEKTLRRDNDEKLRIWIK